MPANTAPIFTVTPKAVGTRLTGANTTRDGSGTAGITIFESFAAGASGSRVDFVTFTSATAAVGTPTAKVGRVFLTDTTGVSTTSKLIAEVALPATVSSNTAIGLTATITFTNGLVIASGQKIYTTISVYASSVDQTDVLVRGGDY